LVTSELFGHVKGAFTGAVSDRQGTFLEADGGTIFLDEIGELPLEVQPLLLRVLEAGTVKRVGENKPRRVDVRVIAATHRDLEAAVKAGTFREDLYFRLAVALIHIPPLRERLEDLPLLIEHFVKELGRPDLGISERILERFAAYAWPGNLRELRNLVERALLGADEGPPAPARASTESKSRALAELPFKAAKEKLLEAFTREYLETLLSRCGGNVSQAARVSGLTRTYLHELIGRYGLSADDP
jgi:DNA-binding NtrC family response regulator